MFTKEEIELIKSVVTNAVDDMDLADITSVELTKSVLEKCDKILEFNVVKWVKS